MPHSDDDFDFDTENHTHDNSYAGWMTQSRDMEWMR